VSSPVRRPRESGLALGTVVAALILLGALLPGAVGAGPDGPSSADLHRQQGRLSVRSHAALLGLYALDARLQGAQGHLERLRGQVEALRREQQLVLRQAGVVEGNLRVSQRLLGDRLRVLYEQGEPDAIAVLLGATSLDDALTRLDELERSASQGAAAAEDARDGREQLRRLAAELSARVTRAQALAAEAERTASSLADARAARVAYIAGLERKTRLTNRQITRLDAQAHLSAVRSDAVQTQVSAQAKAVPAAAGTRTVTVTATGYSLAGNTATGLPVGFGVVAVDPSVIPLGTRLTIPGYGEGVAADTGGSVRGLQIDLWFPTLADALAWGRRTVTITLH
jgi:3D (Asp-Asp-Asp) domain-containing protein